MKAYIKKGAFKLSLNHFLHPNICFLWKYDETMDQERGFHYLFSVVSRFFFMAIILVPTTLLSDFMLSPFLLPHGFHDKYGSRTYAFRTITKIPKQSILHVIPLSEHLPLSAIYDNIQSGESK